MVRSGNSLYHNKSDIQDERNYFITGEATMNKRGCREVSKTETYAITNIVFSTGTKLDARPQQNLVKRSASCMVDLGSANTILHGP